MNDEVAEAVDRIAAESRFAGIVRIDRADDVIFDAIAGPPSAVMMGAAHGALDEVAGGVLEEAS